MKRERTCPQWEKRETPDHCFDNTDFPHGVPYLALRYESTLKPVRLPRLVSKDGCHRQASHTLSDAALSPAGLPLFLSKMDSCMIIELSSLKSDCSFAIRILFTSAGEMLRPAVNGGAFSVNYR